MKSDFKTMSKSQVLSNVDSIIATVCDQFDITMNDIKGISRKNKYVIPRMLTMNILRSKTLLTLKEIAVIFNRDHTTVISAITTSNNLLHTDDVIKEEYQKLLMRL